MVGNLTFYLDTKKSDQFNKFICTTSSPIKVNNENVIGALDNNFTSNTHTSSSAQTTINFNTICSMLIRFLLCAVNLKCFMFYVDTLNKIDRNILNIKYDIKSLFEKLDKIHDDLYSHIGSKEKHTTMTNEEEDFQMLINNQLPLKDEENLYLFENQLKEISFKNKMVKTIFCIKLIYLYNIIIL